MYYGYLLSNNSKRYGLKANKYSETLEKYSKTLLDNFKEGSWSYDSDSNGNGITQQSL